MNNLSITLYDGDYRATGPVPSFDYTSKEFQEAFLQIFDELQENRKDNLENAMQAAREAGQ